MKIVLLLLVCAAFAAAAPARHFPEGNHRPSFKGWSITALPTHSSRKLQLEILLQQQNLDVLEEKFWAVSDPKSPGYGQHMSLEEIADLIAPPAEDIQKVQNWLTSFGVKHHLLKSRDWIKVEATLAQVEKMFNVKFSVFRHRSGRKAGATLDSYSIPMELKGLIKEVSGINILPDMKKQKPRISMTSVGPLAITPSVIRARYNVTSGLTVKHASNINACSEFQAQNYSPQDLSTFFQKYVTTPNIITTVDKIVGQNNGGNPQLEGSLDVQYIMGVSQNSTTWFYSMQAVNFYSDLKTWLGWMNNETVIPHVMSVSYGSQGDYPSLTYQRTSDVEYQKLGLRGMSMIYASGDSGAGCDMNRLAPSYPATSVYVTSVGATRFLQGNTGPEGAVQAFGSGGGFAWETARPSYQDQAVESYLQSGVQLPPANKFNSSARCTPDVAALGDEHFLVINGGQVTPVGGTSASAPTFAAIITLLNDIRITKGESPLGFLNPWIYQTAAADSKAFFDVTVGDNIGGCYRGGQGGFKCAAGYDPVTGVGTPNFEVLQNYV